MSLERPPDGPGPLPPSPGPRRSRRGLYREAAIFIGAAAVLALAALGAQRLLVPRAPEGDLAARLDEGLGSLLREQVRATRIIVDDPDARRAVDLVVARLGGEIPGEERTFTVLIVQSPEINAFALPGNTVCVYTGLLRALGSADELAGVLGHEMSHTVSRDPLTMLMRNLGVAALLNVVSGGQGGAVLSNMAQTFVDVHYGREAEDRADDFSVRLLARAGLPPMAFAEALQRIKEAAPKEPWLLKYLDPHSPIDQRIEKARDLARRQVFSPHPLDVDWEALIEALPGR